MAGPEPNTVANAEPDPVADRVADLNAASVTHHDSDPKPSICHNNVDRFANTKPDHKPDHVTDCNTNAVADYGPNTATCSSPSQTPTKPCPPPLCRPDWGHHRFGGGLCLPVWHSRSSITCLAVSLALLAAIAMMGTWLLFVYAVTAAQQRQCRLFDGDGEQICESAEAATQAAELELETGSEPEQKQKRRRQDCGSSCGNCATAGSTPTHISKEDTKTLRAFDQNSNFGPCMGLDRSARYHRAVRNQQAPPAEVAAILHRHEFNLEVERSMYDCVPVMFESAACDEHSIDQAPRPFPCGCRVDADVENCPKLTGEFVSSVKKSLRRTGVPAKDKLVIREAIFTIFDHLLPAEAPDSDFSLTSQWEQCKPTMSRFAHAFERSAFGVEKRNNGPVYNHVYKKHCGQSSTADLIKEWRAVRSSAFIPKESRLLASTEMPSASGTGSVYKVSREEYGSAFNAIQSRGTIDQAVAASQDRRKREVLAAQRATAELKEVEGHANFIDKGGKPTETPDNEMEEDDAMDDDFMSTVEQAERLTLASFKRHYVEQVGLAKQNKQPYPFPNAMHLATAATTMTVDIEWNRGSKAGLLQPDIYIFDPDSWERSVKLRCDHCCEHVESASKDLRFRKMMTPTGWCYVLYRRRTCRNAECPRVCRNREDHERRAKSQVTQKKTKRKYVARHTYSVFSPGTFDALPEDVQIAFPAVHYGSRGMAFSKDLVALMMASCGDEGGMAPFAFHRAMRETTRHRYYQLFCRYYARAKDRVDDAVVEGSDPRGWDPTTVAKHLQEQGGSRLSKLREDKRRLDAEVTRRRDKVEGDATNATDATDVIATLNLKARQCESEIKLLEHGINTANGLVRDQELTGRALLQLDLDVVTGGGDWDSCDGLDLTSLKSLSAEQRGAARQVLSDIIVCAEEHKVVIPPFGDYRVNLREVPSARTFQRHHFEELRRRYDTNKHRLATVLSGYFGEPVFLKWDHCFKTTKYTRMGRTSEKAVGAVFTIMTGFGHVIWSGMMNTTQQSEFRDVLKELAVRMDQEGLEVASIGTDMCCGDRDVAKECLGRVAAGHVGVDQPSYAGSFEHHGHSNSVYVKTKAQAESVFVNVLSDMKADRIPKIAALTAVWTPKSHYKSKVKGTDLEFDKIDAIAIATPPPFADDASELTAILPPPKGRSWVLPVREWDSLPPSLVEMLADASIDKVIKGANALSNRLNKPSNFPGTRLAGCQDLGPRAKNLGFVSRANPSIDELAKSILDCTVDRGFAKHDWITNPQSAPMMSALGLDVVTKLRLHEELLAAAEATETVLPENATSEEDKVPVVVLARDNQTILAFGEFEGWGERKAVADVRVAKVKVSTVVRRNFIPNHGAKASRSSKPNSSLARKAVMLSAASKRAVVAEEHGRQQLARACTSLQEATAARKEHDDMVLSRHARGAGNVKLGPGVPTKHQLTRLLAARTKATSALSTLNADSKKAEVAAKAVYQEAYSEARIRGKHKELDAMVTAAGSSRQATEMTLGDMEDDGGGDGFDCEFFEHMVRRRHPLHDKQLAMLTAKTDSDGSASEVGGFDMIFILAGWF